MQRVTLSFRLEKLTLMSVGKVNRSEDDIHGYHFLHREIDSLYGLGVTRMIDICYLYCSLCALAIIPLN